MSLRRLDCRGSRLTRSQLHPVFRYPDRPRPKLIMEPATQEGHLSHAFRVTSNISPTMIPSILEKDCILFYHPSCKDLAEKTAAASSSITLGVIDWRCGNISSRQREHRPPSGLSAINATNEHLPRSVFNDGFPNVFVRDALDIRNRHVAFLCSFHEPSVIFEQISVIYALPRLFISSFTLVLPFFPTGTLERVCSHLTHLPRRL